MPEKVTSLNGLKVILEYGSHKLGALNAFYVNYQFIRRIVHCRWVFDGTEV